MTHSRKKNRSTDPRQEALSDGTFGGILSEPRCPRLTDSPDCATTISNRRGVLNTPCTLRPTTRQQYRWQRNKCGNTRTACGGIPRLPTAATPFEKGEFYTHAHTRTYKTKIYPPPPPLLERFLRDYTSHWSAFLRLGTHFSPPKRNGLERALNAHLHLNIYPSGLISQTARFCTLLVQCPKKFALFIKNFTKQFRLGITREVKDE
jgi:hypothetical protein